MSFKRIVMLVVIVFCCQFPLARAGLMTLNEYDSGNVLVNSPCPPPFGSARPPIHRVEFNRVGYDGYSCLFGALGSWIERGYLIFDLTAITAPVTDAALSFNINGLSNVDGALRLYNYSFTSAESLSNLPAGNLGAAFGGGLFNNLGSGNLLGSMNLTSGASPGVYEIQLSNSALGLINRSSGLLALGVSYWPSFSGGNFSLSAGIVGGPTQLKLQAADNVVPAPATLALLAVGLAGLGMSRRRYSGDSLPNSSLRLRTGLFGL